jgi:hypothetical protein
MLASVLAEDAMRAAVVKYRAGDGDGTAGTAAGGAVQGGSGSSTLAGAVPRDQGTTNPTTTNAAEVCALLASLQAESLLPLVVREGGAATGRGASVLSGTEQYNMGQGEGGGAGNKPETHAATAGLTRTSATDNGSKKVVGWDSRHQQQTDSDSKRQSGRMNKGPEITNSRRTGSSHSPMSPDSSDCEEGGQPTDGGNRGDTKPLRRTN